MLAAAGLGFFYFKGKTYTVVVSAAEIRERLEQRLPLTRTYFLFFQVTLDHPRVELIEGSGRVKAGLDVALNIKIGREAKELGGSIDVSGGVKYAAESGQFFLIEPVIEHLSVQGVPPRHAAKINEALTKALNDYYADRPIYTLKATDAKRAAAKLLLKKVTIHNKNLIITLGL